MPVASPAPWTVLVVDGDADMRFYVRSCLAPLDRARVLEAPHGREALRRTLAQVPALIIADVVMPYMSGIALCRALRATPSTASVPLLLMSGETRGPPPCADGFLAKPFNATALRSLVRHLLPTLP